MHGALSAICNNQGGHLPYPSIRDFRVSFPHSQTIGIIDRSCDGWHFSPQKDANLTSTFPCLASLSKVDSREKRKTAGLGSASRGFGLGAWQCGVKVRVLDLGEKEPGFEFLLGTERTLGDLGQITFPHPNQPCCDDGGGGSFIHRCHPQPHGRGHNGYEILPRLSPIS